MTCDPVRAAAASLSQSHSHAANSPIATSGCEPGQPAPSAPPAIQRTLYDTRRDASCGADPPDSITYELNYEYSHFYAIVGVADGSPSADKMKFILLVDGQRKGLSPTLGVGGTVTIGVNVTGAFRITLQSACTSSANARGKNVTAVWVHPVGTP